MSFLRDLKVAAFSLSRTPGVAMAVLQKQVFASLASAFKAGFGYIVGLPVAAYLTWEGKLIEGKGVTPSVSVEIKPEHLLAGEDPQMQRAVLGVLGEFSFEEFGIFVPCCAGYLGIEWVNALVEGFVVDGNIDIF